MVRIRDDAERDASAELSRRSVNGSNESGRVVRVGAVQVGAVQVGAVQVGAVRAVRAEGRAPWALIAGASYAPRPHADRAQPLVPSIEILLSPSWADLHNLSGYLFAWLVLESAKLPALRSRCLTTHIATSWHRGERRARKQHQTKVSKIVSLKLCSKLIAMAQRRRCYGARLSTWVDSPAICPTVGADLTLALGKQKLVLLSCIFMFTGADVISSVPSRPYSVRCSKPPTATNA